MTMFERAFAVVVGHEGVFSADPRDAGNWTAAGCSGECRGTKYGISALAYPYLNIAALTIDQARDLYRRDFWDRLGADALPPRLALVLFDTAVNSGVPTAVRWLQTCVGCVCDGHLGPVTLAATQKAVTAQGVDAVCDDILAARLVALTRLATWPTFGVGWARRICRLAYQSADMEDQP
jgi:lysozyme family protein